MVDIAEIYAMSPCRSFRWFAFDREAAELGRSCNVCLNQTEYYWYLSIIYVTLSNKTKNLDKPYFVVDARKLVYFKVSWNHVKYSLLS